MLKNKTTNKQRPARGREAVLPAKRFPAKAIWVALIAAVAGLLIIGSAVQGFGSNDDSDSLAAQDGLIASSSYPVVIAEQEGLVITARAEGLSEVSWQYKLINPGDACNLETFATAPNDPRIHDSNRLTLPESVELQDPYRNRFVCFKAVGTSDFYGSEWAQYGAWRIDLGNPVISVKAEFPGDLTYLQASSSEDVTYRVTRFKVALHRGGIGGISADGASVVGNYCERNLLSGQLSEKANWVDDWETFADADGRILVEDDSYWYCFEATDTDGNRTYVRVDAYGKDSGSVVDNIYATQWKGEIRVSFTGTSGKVTWSAVGPLVIKACDEYAINNARHKPIRQNPSYYYDRNAATVTLDTADHGKYYCFRATDELGQNSYRYVLVDLQPPEVNLKQTGNSLEVSSDKYILNSWFVGPLDGDEFEDCAEVFAKDESGHYGQLWWERGDRTTSVQLRDGDGDGQYHCVEVEDRKGNTAVGKIKLDRQAPTITVTQNDSELTVESADADLDDGSWGYAAGADLDCDAMASFTDIDTSGSEVALAITAEGAGRYYCFRVADSAGNYGYVKVRVQRPLIIEGVI